MRLARPILLAVLAVSCLSSCQTASGRAIESRFGSALSGLLGNTREFLAHEARRPSRLLRFEPFRDWAPQVRAATIVQTVRDSFTDTKTRLVMLPARLKQWPGQIPWDSATRVRNATDRESRLARNHRPGILLGNFRAGVAWMIRRSDFGRPILGGPGDPDRTTDPNVVTRQQTWVERLLRRF